jgi:MFS family permease
MAYMVLMPIFADKVLQSGARGLGWLMTSAGFGALLGALSLARRKNVLGLDRVVSRASTGFGVSLVLFGLSKSLWLSMILLVPAGFCLMVQMAATNTLVQSIVSDSMRGRVMGLYTMMFLGIAPFGSLLAGFLAQRYSAPFAVILGGLACVVSASIFGYRLRQLKIDSHFALPSPETPSDVV